MIDSVGLQFLFVLAVLFVASAWAQTDPFPLATTGCSKIHSSPHEDGAIGIVPPTPITGGTVKKVHYFLTGGDGKAIGCTSSGSVVACKAENSTSGPILTVYDGSGTFVYSSCTTPTATDCSTATAANDPCGTSVTDYLDSEAGPALVGSDGTVIVADDLRIYLSVIKTQIRPVFE